MLKQIDAIGLEALEGHVNLTRGQILSSRIDLGHQKHFIAIAAPRERVPHANLTAALVVIPGIVHEGDAAVNSRMNKAYAFAFRHRCFGNMRAAEPDRGDCFAGLPQFAIEHFTFQLAWRSRPEQFGGVPGAVRGRC
jgi:hypothetical protein